MTDPALPNGANFRLTRTAHGLILNFPPLRAPGPALGLLAFAALCALMPALGLSALLPLDNTNAAAIVSLALIGGFAAPFIFTSAVFAVLACYMLANSLRVEITVSGITTERRVLGRVTRRSHIARADITEVEPRISARFQNLFGATPRYTLIAHHRESRANDVVIAEDLAGEPVMRDVRALACRALEINNILHSSSLPA